MNAYFYKAGPQVIQTAVNHPGLFPSNFSKLHWSRWLYGWTLHATAVLIRGFYDR